MVFKHIPTNFAAKILRLYNNLFLSGHILSSWRRTLFMMLAKHRQAALVTDFRSVRLFYKIFAYVILHRIEPCLDSHQPEKQNGFRAGRRLEEHLLTANFFLDKTLAANIPVWILSLDLSKAFDRVDWGGLWLALARGCQRICCGLFKPCTLVNMVKSLDKKGTAVPFHFKSMQACDKDVCSAQKCFLLYFIGQCQSGEHGRTDVRLDLILVMVCHHFWI